MATGNTSRGGFIAATGPVSQEQAGYPSSDPLPKPGFLSRSTMTSQALDQYLSPTNMKFAANLVVLLQTPAYGRLLTSQHVQGLLPEIKSRAQFKQLFTYLAQSAPHLLQDLTLTRALVGKRRELRPAKQAKQQASSKSIPLSPDDKALSKAVARDPAVAATWVAAAYPQPVRSASNSSTAVTDYAPLLRLASFLQTALGGFFNFKLSAYVRSVVSEANANPEVDAALCQTIGNVNTLWNMARPRTHVFFGLIPRKASTVKAEAEALASRSEYFQARLIREKFIEPAPAVVTPTTPASTLVTPANTFVTPAKAGVQAVVDAPTPVTPLRIEDAPTPQSIPLPRGVEHDATPSTPVSQRSSVIDAETPVSPFVSFGSDSAGAPHSQQSTLPASPSPVIGIAQDRQYPLGTVMNAPTPNSPSPVSRVENDATPLSPVQESSVAAAQTPISPTISMLSQQGVAADATPGTPSPVIPAQAGIQAVSDAATPATPTSVTPAKAGAQAVVDAATPGTPSPVIPAKPGIQAAATPETPPANENAFQNVAAAPSPKPVSARKPTKRSLLQELREAAGDEGSLGELNNVRCSTSSSSLQAQHARRQGRPLNVQRDNTQRLLAEEAAARCVLGGASLPSSPLSMVR